MRDRFIYSYFSIEPVQGWTASVRDAEIDPYVSIVPDSGDVQFRLTPPSADAPPIEPQRWVETVAKINRMKNREVIAVVCGDFSGYNIPFETDIGFISGWALHHKKWSLSGYYHCPVNIRGRDNDVVNEMLRSLKIVL